MYSSRFRAHPFLWVLASIIAVSLVILVIAGPEPIGDGGGESPTGADPGDVYDPVRAGEDLPATYRPLLERDRIAPVYDPVFTTASNVDWPADTLVIGISAAGSAKAYPVAHLNSREMVIDSLDGIPLLVSW